MKMIKNEGWSEQDERKFNNIIALVEGKAIMRKDIKVLVNLLKSLKDRIQPQPKQDWSEEDEKCLENAIMYCEWARDKAPDLYCYETSEKSINWLKSLRPNDQWKPSDKQIEALDFAVDCIVPAEFCFKRKELKGLLEQLKKLKE